jgi:beta-glucosidase-like glycosyl hydrolase
MLCEEGMIIVEQVHCQYHKVQNKPHHQNRKVIQRRSTSFAQIVE